MKGLPPITTILVGFFLVLLGAVLAWLMVLHIIRSTYFLNFLSYAASVLGLFLGLVGAALYVRLNKNKKP
jgi:hypothetical protein